MLTNCCLNTNNRALFQSIVSNEEKKKKKEIEEWSDTSTANYKIHESKNSYLYMTLSTVTYRDQLLRCAFTFSIFDPNANRPILFLLFTRYFCCCCFFVWFVNKFFWAEAHRKENNTVLNVKTEERHTLKMQTDRVLESTVRVDVKCLLTLSIIISYVW